jgi:uncharacterized protein YbjT (DUF2867 family)
LFVLNVAYNGSVKMALRKEQFAMAKVLVTGGTGTLGREVVACLLGRQHSARVLGHQANPSVPQGVEVFHGGLAADARFREAVAGVDAIIHCASSPQSAPQTDVKGTRLLTQAAREGGTPHIIYISIVGIDRSEYAYYKAKRETEMVIERSGLPWTILRATQFHDLVLRLIQGFGADTLSEVAVAGGMRFQSIDTREVAERLVTLMERGPTGQAPDIGGPEVCSIEEMTEVYLRVRGRKATVRSELKAGELFDVFRSGINLCPEHTEGKITWEAFLRRLYG